MEGNPGGMMKALTRRAVPAATERVATSPDRAIRMV